MSPHRLQGRSPIACESSSSRRLENRSGPARDNLPAGRVRRIVYGWEAAMGTYRLDFAFQAGDLRLTGVSDSSQNAPGDDPIVPAGTGFWLTVHDRSGRQTHAQILRDPRTG